MTTSTPTASQKRSLGSLKQHAGNKSMTSRSQSRYAASEMKSLQQAEEEDEAVFENLLKKSKRNCFHYQFKSICSTLFFTVGATIALLFGICIAWALLFSSNTKDFGNRLIQSTFRELTQSIHHETSSISMTLDSIAVDRDLLHPNSTNFDVIYPKLYDTFTELKKTQESFTLMYYGPDLMTRMMLSTIQGYGHILFADSQDTGSLNYYHNTSMPFGRGDLISKRGSSLPPTRPTSLNTTLKVPRHFQEVTTLACSYSTRTCRLVLLGYRTAYIENGAVKHALEINFAINFMNSLLNNLTHKEAVSFIIQKNDQRLVALSKFEELSQKDSIAYSMYEFIGETNRASMKLAHEYPLESVSEVTKYMREIYGERLEKLIPISDSDSDTHFSLGSKTIDTKLISLVRSTHTDEPGVLDDFLLVHVIESEAFTHTATQLSIIMGAATAVIGLISLCMVSCISIAIWRPLRLLIGQMEKAKFLQFDKINTNRFTYFSELREIQSSFYFMTQSMKQYRSFLPAHLLQTIEARLQQHHNDKKKKNTNKINPSAAEDDELVSLSSSAKDVDSDTHSKYSHSIARSSSSVNKVRHQFHVGATRHAITIVEVYIIGLEDILKQTALEDFTHIHSKIVETIEQAVNTTKGATFNHFDHDRFLISLNSTISCRDRHEKQGAFLSMKLKDRLQRCNAGFMREGFREIPLLICVSSGWAVVSLLGSANMKQQTMHGQPLLLSRIIRDSTVVELLSAQQQDIFFSGGNVPVLIDQSIKSKLPEKKIEFKQVNHLDVYFKDMTMGIQVFELKKIISNDSTKDQEWLYTMRDDELMKRYQKNLQDMNSAWDILVKQGNCDEALETVRDILEKADASSQEMLFEEMLRSVTKRIQEEHGGDVEAYRGDQINSSKGNTLDRVFDASWRNCDGMRWKSFLQQARSSSS